MACQPKRPKVHGADTEEVHGADTEEVHGVDSPPKCTERDTEEVHGADTEEVHGADTEARVAPAGRTQGHVRRTRYLLFRGGNDGDVEPDGLLRGVISVAVSILAGTEVALEAGDLDTLLAVPTDDWIPTADAGDHERVLRLALAGLLISDDPDERLVELRARDRQLAEHGWYLYAALYHSLTRRLDTDLELAEDLDERRQAKANTAVAQRTARGGPPPAAFHRSPLGRSVHDLPLEEPNGAFFELLRRRRTAADLRPGRHDDDRAALGDPAHRVRHPGHGRPRPRVRARRRRRARPAARCTRSRRTR